MFEKTHNQVLEECERLGELGVRAKLEKVGSEAYSYNEAPSAKAWLKSREEETRAREAALSATSAKATATADETQARWAKYSAAITAIAFAIANRDDIVKFISFLLGLLV